MWGYLILCVLFGKSHAFSVAFPHVQIFPSSNDTFFPANLTDYMFGSALCRLPSSDTFDEHIVVGAQLDNGTGSVYIITLYKQKTIQLSNSLRISGSELNASSGDLFGSSLACSDSNRVAIGMPGANQASGAVLTVTLQTTGVYSNPVLLQEGSNGLNLNLSFLDEFGSSVAWIGDLNGDGTQDLAVGASHSAGGGVQRGAVYLLFLQSNGNVQSSRKISPSQGGFSGALDYAQFGFSLSFLGHFLSEPGPELAVGAIGASAGNQEGAVYILTLQSDGDVQKTTTLTSQNVPSLSANGWFGSAIVLLDTFDTDFPVLGVTAVRDNGNSTEQSWFGALYLLSIDTSGILRYYEKISNNLVLIEPQYQFGSALLDLPNLKSKSDPSPFLVSSTSHSELFLFSDPTVCRYGTKSISQCNKKPRLPIYEIVLLLVFFSIVPCCCLPYCAYRMYHKKSPFPTSRKEFKEDLEKLKDIPKQIKDFPKTIPLPFIKHDKQSVPLEEIPNTSEEHQTPTQQPLTKLDPSSDEESI